MSVSSQKQFSVSRKEIINAIETGPIGAGSYATSKPLSKGVKVNAVGAVLLNLAAVRKSAKVIYDLSTADFNAVASFNSANNEHLGLLDTEYNILRNGSMRAPKIRATLSAWVKDTFPAKVELTVWNPATVAA